MKLIDYNKLRKHLVEQAQIASDYNINDWRIICRTLLDVIDFIDGMGFIDPERHGKWIINTDDFTPAFRCTCCGYNKPMIAGVGANNDPGRYCQNCGAKMEGVDGK